MIQDEATGRDWPAEGLEVVGACPACGASGRSLWHEALSDRIFFCAPGRWRMWRCTGCGAGYLDPRPDAATIGLAYASYYTHQGATEPPWLAGATALGRRAGIRNAYLRQRYPRFTERPRWPGAGWALGLDRDARALLARDVRHLPAPAPGERLLDVGSGDGAFLVRARSLGYQAQGREFDPAAVATARARGLDVSAGGFPAPELAAGAYAAITLSQVLEHLHAPRAAIAEAHRLLRPGGFLWIATPNAEAPGHRRYGPDWRGLEPPRHLVLYSAGALAQLLAEGGFREVRFRPPGPVTRWFFEASERVRAGVPPGEPVTIAPERLAEAEGVDRVARRDPRAGEELVVTAVRG